MRPRHIDAALRTLRAVALTQPSVITGGELMEISHYVARLERRLAERPSILQQFKAWWAERRGTRRHVP